MELYKIHYKATFTLDCSVPSNYDNLLPFEEIKNLVEHQYTSKFYKMLYDELYDPDLFNFQLNLEELDAGVWKEENGGE